MFDSVLRPQAPPGWRLASGLCIALAFATCLVTFAAWAAARTPPEAPEVSIAVRLLAPPPPRAAAVARRSGSRPTPRPRPPPALVQPKAVPPAPIPQEAPPEREAEQEAPAVDGDSLASGEPDGVPGGVVGGVLGPGAAPPPPPPRPDFDGETMRPPTFVSGPSPEYTARALEREVQGLMVVTCVVTVEGTVFGCRVVEGLPFMDRAVVDALEHRRYRPATIAGRPLEVNYTFRITLRLPD